jgi:hypothetical protein
VPNLLQICASYGAFLGIALLPSCFVEASCHAEFNFEDIKVGCGIVIAKQVVFICRLLPYCLEIRIQQLECGKSWYEGLGGRT